MDFLTHNPFIELLGMKLQCFEPGKAQILLPLRQELTNSWGVAHGGVMMTLLDVVMAHAARSPDAITSDIPPGVVTVEMKTSFMRPGLGSLQGVGKLLQKTPSMAFCEGSVLDSSGKLLAHATGTFKYMKGLPLGKRQIQRLSASD